MLLYYNDSDNDVRTLAHFPEISPVVTDTELLRLKFVFPACNPAPVDQSGAPDLTGSDSLNRWPLVFSQVKKGTWFDERSEEPRDADNHIQQKILPWDTLDLVRRWWKCGVAPIDVSLRVYVKDVGKNTKATPDTVKGVCTHNP